MAVVEPGGEEPSAVMARSAGTIDGPNSPEPITTIRPLIGVLPGAP
ncbi:MAG: hypothetical protein H0V96_12655 [Acidimicrobiia bacterium]|nr:hypothetical protein [Acidimicrobiia bacterium]